MACLDRGIEVRRDFQVLVKQDGIRLPGVSVKIESTPRNTDMGDLSAVTSSDRIVYVNNLPAGDYWLTVELLGINVAYHCFHVAAEPTGNAKRILEYDWGEWAPTTRRVAGRLIDSQPGRGSNPLWNIVFRVEVPISGAQLRLRNPVTAEVFHATSDEDGRFDFIRVPEGTYALHVEGGSTGRRYEATDLVMTVSTTAERGELLLKRQEPAAGNCGGTSLDLVDLPGK